MKGSGMDYKAILKQIKQQNEDDIQIVPEFDIEKAMDAIFWQDESKILADWEGAISQQEHDRLLNNHMASYRRNSNEVRMKKVCKVQYTNNKFQGYSAVNWFRMM